MTSKAPVKIIGVPDGETIDFTGRAMAAYHIGRPAATTAETLRDIGYYFSGYLAMRGAGRNHDDAMAKVEAAARIDGRMDVAVLTDDELIAQASRFKDRYETIGRFQRQTLFENVRDQLYWLMIFMLQRQAGKDVEAALREMERGMAKEAGMEDPYPVTRGGGGGLAGRIRVDGRFFINDAGTFRPRFQSGLYLCVRTPEERAAFLDDTVALGFNGFRVFCGHLGQVNQTPELARQVLPTILDEAAARGLYVYVCALTGGGYDIEAHLRDVAAICAAVPNALLECANEIGHPSQSDIGKDPARLLAIARRVIPADVTWTLGAPMGTDEPTSEGTYPTAGGMFNDAHLDRGRDLYNQVRRVREIENISATLRTPAMSGEPIGIAEVPMPGKQRYWGDDALRFSFIYGLLCRGFEVACLFHSEQGLQAQPLGPNTAAAARACLDGFQTIPTDDRLTFQNASWRDSPIKSFSGAVRVYTFITGNRGWSVVIAPDHLQIETANGWRLGGLVAEQPGVQVFDITR